MSDDQDSAADISTYAIAINYGNGPSITVVTGSRTNPSQNIFPKSSDSNRLYACFLDRHTYAPPAGKIFQWNDPSVVPDGMQEYLTSKYILAFGCVLTVPMQELYQTLMDNGAGSQLLNLENMQAQVAYGTSQSSMYALISVPSSKINSVESAQLLTQPFGGPPSSGTPQTIYYLAAQMVGTPTVGYSPQPLWP